MLFASKECELVRFERQLQLNRFPAVLQAIPAGVFQLVRLFRRLSSDFTRLRPGGADFVPKREERDELPSI